MATVRWEKVRPNLVFVNDYYDWPLSGILRLNGVDWRFNRIDPYSNRVKITRLSRFEAWQAWRQRTAFGVCVGWHWHYKNGRPKCYFGGRRPAWFWGMLANLYYGKQPFAYPFFPRKRSRPTPSGTGEA